NFFPGMVQASFLKLAFKDVGGILTANFSDEHFAQPNAYFLGIKTKLDPTALARYVEDGDKFKLMPQSLATRAIRGIELKEERHQPQELPAAADLQHFRQERATGARRRQQRAAGKAAAGRCTSARTHQTHA